jgi:hypothetical protein
MPATVKRNQGKTMFVKEVLHDNPRANARAVNDEWQAAGMEGQISATLVSKMRARMGLAGNLRGTRAKGAKFATSANAGLSGAPKRRGRPPKDAASASNGIAPSPSRGKKNTLGTLEIEFDRLLLKVVEFGSLPDVETALRKARRLLYAGTFPST